MPATAEYWHVDVLGVVPLSITKLNVSSQHRSSHSLSPVGGIMSMSEYELEDVFRAGLLSNI